MEHRRRRPPRERRLKAGKMLYRSILSESPSSCAAKACEAWGAGAIAEPEAARFFVFEKGANVTGSKTKNASIKNKKNSNPNQVLIFRQKYNGV